MDYRFRISMVKNGHKVFGEGPLILLKKVEELGSLRQAAISMEMSYSKAWSMIKNIEKELGMTILKRSVGGQDGGGSAITEEGWQLMKRYENLKKRVEEKIREEMKIFGDE